MDVLEFRVPLNVKKIGHIKHIYLIDKLCLIESIEL